MGGDPVSQSLRFLIADAAEYWMPAFAGMTAELNLNSSAVAATGGALTRRAAEFPGKAPRIGRPDFRIDDTRRALAGQCRDHLLGGDLRHVAAGIVGNAGGVRADEHVVERHQRVVVRRRLLLPHIEA